jgi:maleylacetate reductase
VLPAAVVYDIDLTLGLPPETSVTSAVNALAHAVEAVYAPDGSPLVDLMAAEAILVLAAGIPRMAADPASADTRSELLYGAWLAGTCLGATTMSLHHKLCHVMGGAFDLPHAWTHTAVLPYVMDVNLDPGTRRHTVVSAGFAAERPGAALLAMLGRLGYRRSLADLGLPASGIDQVVAAVLAAPYANPKQLTPEQLRGVVEAAYYGAGLGS